MGDCRPSAGRQRHGTGWVGDRLTRQDTWWSRGAVSLPPGPLPLRHSTTQRRDEELAVEQDFDEGVEALRVEHGSDARVRDALEAPTSRYARIGKPLLDRTLALVLLVLTLPLLGLVALVVLVDLGSPVLFRQERVGRGGRHFSMLKFRTMRPDRRTRPAPFDGPDRRRTHKHPSDPRLTRVGRVLRAWSLDELPQLVHVVRGEMSLVGPRPELVSVVARYEGWQHYRHLVKPGLTGLWQVTERGSTPMHERTDLDLDYLRDLSLVTDLRIMLRTVPAALGHRRGS